MAIVGHSPLPRGGLCDRSEIDPLRGGLDRDRGRLGILFSNWRCDSIKNGENLRAGVTLTQHADVSLLVHEFVLVSGSNSGREG